MLGILLEEAGWDDLLRTRVQAGRSSISTANLFEVFLVLHGRRLDQDADRVMDLLDAVNLKPTPVTTEQVMIVREAFRRYGKGFDAKAKLNYGDCFSYPLAKATGEPLLFVGGDFTHTDIVPALTT